MRSLCGRGRINSRINSRGGTAGSIGDESSSDVISDCLSANAISITDAGIAREPAMETPSAPADAAKFKAKISTQAAAVPAHAHGEGQSSSRHQEVGRESRVEGRGRAEARAALKISSRHPAGICRGGCWRRRCSKSSGFI